MNNNNLQSIIDLDGEEEYLTNDILKDDKRLVRASQLNEHEEALLDVFNTKLRDLAYEMLNDPEEATRKAILRSSTDIRDIFDRILGYKVEADRRSEKLNKAKGNDDVPAEDLEDSENYGFNK